MAFAHRENTENPNQRDTPSSIRGPLQRHLKWRRKMSISKGEATTGHTLPCPFALFGDAHCFLALTPLASGLQHAPWNSSIWSIHGDDLDLGTF
jgi:hypothetical protein